jgi:cellulose biosynthesis protein BcsQ
LDPQIAESVLVLALCSGFANDKVLVLAPIKHEKWLLDQFDKMVTSVFEVCKKYPEQTAKMVRGYSQLFKKVTLTGRLLQLQREPQYWVAFGFSGDDVLPDWMPRRLLSREPLV